MNRRLLAACTAMLFAADPPVDSARLKDRLAEVRTRMAQVDQQVTALKKRRKGVLVELQEISLRAQKARAQADGARAMRDAAMAEVQDLGTRKTRIAEEVGALQVGLRKQVRWLQAVGPWEGFAFLVSVRTLEDFLVQDRYRSWYQNRERIRLEKVRSLQAELSRREEEIRLALARLKKEEAEAEMLEAALEHQESQMEHYLDELQKDEGKQKAVQSELAEEMLQLERMLTGLLGKAKGGDAFEPKVSFASLKGRLPKPVAGTLAQGFGEHLHPKFHTRTFRTGLLVTAQAGAPVQAVADGRVVMAEPYQSFGPMVILEHGGGWHTLYAHLQSAVVTKGQVIKAGDAVGHVGETMDGPRLGFEVRQLAQPQDPQKWLEVRYK